MLFKLKRTSSNYWDFISPAALYVPGKKLSAYTSDDAVCAWCKKCNCEVTFGKGDIKPVISHLDCFHKEHLKNHQEASQKTKASRDTVVTHQTSLKDSFASSKKATASMPKASKADQKKADALSLLWITSSLRSFNAINDYGLRMLFDFLNAATTAIEIPDRTKLSTMTVDLNTKVCETVKLRLAKEMKWYCITTDIWTSRNVESFMAITIHYLNSSFEMQNFVLELRQFGESHSADNIR